MAFPQNEKCHQVPSSISFKCGESLFSIDPQSLAPIIRDVYFKIHTHTQTHTIYDGNIAFTRYVILTCYKNPAKQSWFQWLAISEILYSTYMNITLKHRTNIKYLLLNLVDIISLSSDEWTGKMQNKVKLTLKREEVSINMKTIKHFFSLRWILMI